MDYEMWTIMQNKPNQTQTHLFVNPAILSKICLKRFAVHKKYGAIRRGSGKFSGKIGKIFISMSYKRPIKYDLQIISKISRKNRLFYLFTLNYPF
jgi:hypothetical protein